MPADPALSIRANLNQEANNSVSLLVASVPDFGAGPTGKIHFMVGWRSPKPQLQRRNNEPKERERERERRNNELLATVVTVSLAF
jgi:hypothetical protein